MWLGRDKRAVILPVQRFTKLTYFWCCSSACRGAKGFALATIETIVNLSEPLVLTTSVRFPTGSGKIHNVTLSLTASLQ